MDYSNPIVIDFETYYDDEYSLKKMTTEAYIRDPRFECMGLSIKDGNKGTKFYREEQGIELVRQLILQTKRPVVAHNARFDGGILALKYGLHPKHYIDTKPLMTVAHFAPAAGGDSLAKAAIALQKAGHSIQNKGEFLVNMLGVHAADMSEQDWLDYGNYCIGDVDICHKLYMVLYPIVPEAELRMMDVTTRMYTNPLFEFDVEILKDYYKRLETQRVDNLTFFTQHFGFNSITETETALRSRKKFPELLESLGVPCPMKWSEKQEKYVPALAKTDEALTTLLEHHNPLVADLVSTKLGVNQTLALSRCRHFLELGLRGNLPVPLNYAKAHTGRYGGCLVGSTRVLCKTKGGSILGRQIPNVLPDDLVWDGEEWCVHDGMVFSGYQLVIYHDGVTGTPEHRVYTESNQLLPLEEAKTKNLLLKTCRTYQIPTPSDIGISGDRVPVYDILNCGPRHRFWANGKLVHNSDKLNVQNLPKRSGDTTLRRSIIAPKDHVVIASDSSQVEARCLVYMANEQRVVDIFISGECPYSDMAASIYDMTYDQIYHDAKIVPTKEGVTRRNVGKTTILGCGYQMGATAFAEQLRIAGLDSVMDMAPEIVKTYRATNPNVKAFWATCETAIKVMIAGGDMWFGGPNNDLFYASGTTNFWGVRTPSIRMPDGTYLKYHNLRTEPDPEAFNGYATVYEQYKYGNYVRNYLYGGKLAENITQSIAFAILKHQALIIDAAGVPVNLNVHDEWVSVVHKRDAKAAVRIHAHAMRQVPDYMPQGLLDCEVDMGKNYMDTTTIKGV